MVRDAQPDDVEAIGALWARCWHESYRGIVPDKFIAQVSAARLAERLSGRLADPAHTIWTALVDGAPAAVCTVAASRDEGAGDHEGELVALYVDPPHQGQGLGTTLVPVALHRLRADGFASAMLWTFAANAPALALYEAFGFRPDGGEQTLMETRTIRLRVAL